MNTTPAIAPTPPPSPRPSTGAASNLPHACQSVPDTQTADLDSPQGGGRTKRGIPGPFAWLLKADLKKIRASFDEPGQIASAILVYVALAESASENEDAATTTTSQAHLGALVGLSCRTVFRRLHDLQEIGVLSISTPKLKSPSSYTLTRYDTMAERSATVSQRSATVAERSATETDFKVRLYNERNKEREKGALKPLATAQRISLEHQCSLLKEKIETLEANRRNGWTLSDDELAALEDYKVKLAGIEGRLLE